MSAANLEIRFAAGERPHLFWVSDWVADRAGGKPLRARYKILSKRLAAADGSDAGLEVLVIEERSDGARRACAHERVGRERPSGWLEHWVDDLAASLRADFQRFDLRAIASEREWEAETSRLGWRSQSGSRR